MQVPDIIPSESITIHKVANGFVLVPDGQVDYRTHIATTDQEVLMGVSMWMLDEAYIRVPAPGEPPTASTPSQEPAA